MYIQYHQLSPSCHWPYEPVARLLCDPVSDGPDFLRAVRRSPESQNSGSRSAMDARSSAALRGARVVCSFRSITRSAAPWPSPRSSASARSGVGHAMRASSARSISRTGPDSTQGPLSACSQHSFSQPPADYPNFLRYSAVQHLMPTKTPTPRATGRKGSRPVRCRIWASAIAVSPTTMK